MLNLLEQGGVRCCVDRPCLVQTAVYACAAISIKIGSVKNVVIWGNHSNTQYVDAKHAKVDKDGNLVDVPTAIGDDAWLKRDFLSVSSAWLLLIIDC